MMRGALALAVAVALVLPVTGAADQVRTRAWAHEQFGRIVFDWPSAVTHRTAVSKGRLTVTFDRTIETSFKSVRRNLGRYISGIALGPDGKSVVARLTRGVRVRSFNNKTAVVVDLMDAAAPGAAQPKAQPEAKAKAKARSPVLRVRTGKHLGFGRIVFDWTRPVTYTVVKSGGQITIRFDRAARINLAKLNAGLPAQVSGITSSPDRGGLEVRLRVPGDARVRHFRDGSKVVLDVLSGVKRNAAAKPKRDSGAGHDKTITAGAASPGPGRRPIALVPSVRRDAGQETKSKSKRKRKTKRRLRRHAKRFGPRGAVVTVDAERSENDLSITFNWRTVVAAAAYVRNQRLWLAFDEPARIALGAMQVIGKGIIERVEQYPQPKATLLGFGLPVRYEVVMTRDGTRWTLHLKNRDPRALTDGALTVRAEAGPAGRRRVVVAAKAASEPIRFRDPDVGDALIVIALGEPGQRVTGGRSFVEFSLFPTIQGVVVRRISESVGVGVDDSSVVISARGGLTISASEDTSRHGADEDDDGPLWNITAWQLGSLDDFERNRLALIGRVMHAPPARRNAARIRLARFYLSHGMAADAVGVAQTVMRQRPTAEQIVSLRAVRGAANLLLRHYGDALKDLDRENLKDEPGVIPWLAAISAERGDWITANDGFTGAEQALARFPRWLAIRFNMMAFEAALAVDDLKRAKRLLKTLQLERLPPGKLEYLDFLRGHLFKKDKQPKKALEIWAALVPSDNRLVSAKAAFARIEMLRDLNQIEPAKAIQRLEELSFAWRGDAYEFDLLRRLGELHIAAKDYRSGLVRLRQAASYFEGVDGAESVTKLMGEFFKKLYLEGLADDLPPVRALALYDEFRELTPPGADGEKMIQLLADRLAKVDLLDQAADLLSHQIEFRLTGPDKARVAARLAEIRLLDREPTLALEALARSVIADIPEDTSRARRRLKARALGDLGRLDEAMDAMRDDYDRAANEVRLGILWRAGSWRLAADAIQRSMGLRGVEAGRDDDARRVLQWAVALAMIDDDIGLASLRDRFLDGMSKTPFAMAFRTIVGTEAGGASDFKTLADRIGDLDNLKTFLAKFREPDQPVADGAVN